MCYLFETKLEANRFVANSSYFKREYLGKLYLSDLDVNETRARGITASYWIGITYEGELVNDKRDGKGRYFERGPKGKYCSYNGDRVNDKYEGKGKLYNQYGELMYEGDFEKGKAEGKGKYYYESGVLQYEGDGYKEGNFKRVKRY